MDFRLLDILAKTGVAYLHPGGKKSTAYLISKIKPVSGMKILEIGCGTGATLADLSLNTGVHLYGADISEQMLKTAQQRLNYCGISSVNLKLVQPGGKLPFEDDFFDAVYAESVLGIIEQPALSTLLADIRRVLKPAGAFFSVDAVWELNTPKEKISEINHRCLKDFGIIQSNGSLAAPNAWEDLFSQSGFVNVASVEIKEVNAFRIGNVHVNSVSDKFTQRKMRVAFLNPLLVMAYISSLFLIKCFHRNDGKHLENYFFQMEKSR